MTATKLSSDQPTFGGSRRERLDVVPGLYYVRVHPDAVRSQVPVRVRAGAASVAFTAATAEHVPESVTEPLEYLQRNTGLKSVRPLFRDAGGTRLRRASVSKLERASLAVAASVVTEQEDDIAGLAIVELDPDADVSAIKHAASANAIDYIEPVPARWLASGSGPTNDPMENLQWGLRVIGWFEADRPEPAEVSVAILDTGIDAGHPDLEPVDIIYDHVGTSAEDIVGHGTHVAGIVAAAVNNGVGIAGVANCALHAWKIFGDTPVDGEYYVDPDLIAEALRGAADAGVRAVNLSIGGTLASSTEQRLIRRLTRGGTLVVAAMGNEFNDGNPVEYPAAYETVLAVGAVAETRERSDFSNTGRHIGLCAPGSNILSTLPRRRSAYRPSERMYAAWSGTSMATPHVAAAAGLVAARNPKMDAGQIADHLRNTATKLPAMRGKARTNEYGSGLLDLHRALS